MQATLHVSYTLIKLGLRDSVILTKGRFNVYPNQYAHIRFLLCFIVIFNQWILRIFLQVTSSILQEYFDLSYKNHDNPIQNSVIFFTELVTTLTHISRMYPCTHKSILLPDRIVNQW